MSLSTRPILFVALLFLVALVSSACDGNTAPPTPILSTDPLTGGIARYDAGDYFGAIEDFTEVLENDPDNTEALHKRGWSYLNTSDYDLGYRDLDAMVKVAPDDARAHYGRG